MNALEKIRTTVLSSRPFEFLAGEAYPQHSDAPPGFYYEDDFARQAVQQHLNAAERQSRREWNTHLTSLDGIRKTLQRMRGQ